MNKIENFDFFDVLMSEMYSKRQIDFIPLDQAKKAIKIENGKTIILQLVYDENAYKGKRWVLSIDNDITEITQENFQSFEKKENNVKELIIKSCDQYPSGKTVIFTYTPKE